MEYIVNEILVKQEISFRPHYSLILDSVSSEKTIVFNGLHFGKEEKSQIDTQGFLPLQGYSSEHDNMPVTLTSIKHDWDIFFLLFGNGEIFQIYFMMDSAQSPQQIEIFRPAQSNYQLAIERANACEGWEF
jgi:hypothetical protein